MHRSCAAAATICGYLLVQFAPLLLKAGAVPASTCRPGAVAVELYLVQSAVAARRGVDHARLHGLDVAESGAFEQHPGNLVRAPNESESTRDHWFVAAEPDRVERVESPSQ